MEKKICKRCNKEYDGSGFMWDFQKDGKQYVCEIVCTNCDKEMNPSRYSDNGKDKQIAELQEKLSEAQKLLHTANGLTAIYKDKLHRRNMLIKTLQKDKAECYRLSALLGRLGYDLKGNKTV